MNPYQAHSMLVTGGSGFIGTNFIQHVLKHEPNIHIINLDKLTYAAYLPHTEYAHAAERYHFIQADILDAALVKHLLQQHHIDTIVHFAAESHVDRSIAHPETFISTNVLGTFTLLEAAYQYWQETKHCDPHLCRFHHISTDEVYGSLDLNAPSFNEKHPYHPRSPYAASKAGSDHIAKAYHHTYGLPLTLSHCSNNYGPYQHAEKFIPTIINACLKEQPIPIYGQGKNIRDWLYVEDHCRGILHILKYGAVGETYDMGANNEWENIKLAHYICEQMDQLYPRKKSYTSLLSFVTDRKGHDFRYAIDSSKIQTELNWNPQEEFASGIQKTIAWIAEKSKA
jgi:dTDP-glucose 4,6-dehydratase